MEHLSNFFTLSTCISCSVLALIYWLLNVYIWIYVCGHMCYGMHVEIRGRRRDREGGRGERRREERHRDTETETERGVGENWMASYSVGWEDHLGQHI